MTEADFQLCEDCQDPEALFRSDEWSAEEKLDGERRMIVKRGGEVTAYTRQGRAVPLHIEDAILARNSLGDFTADGEQMPGARFHAFVGFGISPLAPHFAGITAAAGEAAKRTLFAEVRARGGEGIVFKRLGAQYHPGRNDDWQRLKFYETDTFRVTGHPTMASVEIERDGVPWGRCPFPLEKTLPPGGTLIRVRYDRATVRGKLLRPKFAGLAP